MSNRGLSEKWWSVQKDLSSKTANRLVHPKRANIVERAKRTKDYVSTAKEQERRLAYSTLKGGRLFSTFP